jgi:hypothetical protein
LRLQHTRKYFCRSNGLSSNIMPKLSMNNKQFPG